LNLWRRTPLENAFGITLWTL